MDIVRRSVLLVAALGVALLCGSLSSSACHAQQCNVQQSQQSLSSAAALQDLVRAVQLGQARAPAPASSAFASAGAPVSQGVTQQQLSALLAAVQARQVQAPAATSSATATAGVPAPSVSTDQLLSLLSASQPVASSGCANGSCSRSRALSRVISGGGLRLPQIRPATSRSRSLSVVRQ